MENTLQNMVLRVNNINKLHQTDARAYKEKLHLEFKEAIEQMGYDVTRIENALLVEIGHDELGAIPVEVKLVIKPIDFDIEAAKNQYNEKLEKAKERLAKKEKEKALNIAAKG